MIDLWQKISKGLATHNACALVTILAVRGSAPRDAGTRLVVFPDGGFHGTIGGGALEWRILAEAQKLAGTGRRMVARSTHPLGPSLGQCCGGSVDVLVEVLNAKDRDLAAEMASLEQDKRFAVTARIGETEVTRTLCDEAPDAPLELQDAGHMIEAFGTEGPLVLLFGAGHVGRAIVFAAAGLPMRIKWIDSREETFPPWCPANVDSLVSKNPVAELQSCDEATSVLIMTHSHGLDLELTHAALATGRFGYVGLIGSATKKARFAKRMRAGGLTPDQLDHLTCPIGIPGISGKEPAVIAASVVCELLQQHELVKNATKPVPLQAVTG